MSKEGSRMLAEKQYEDAQRRAVGFYGKAGIVLTPKEKEGIEVTDFRLGDLENIGLEIVVYVNTERVCAKELAMFPRQTCPEHKHPMIDGRPCKEETFRCRGGEVYLCVSGEKTAERQAIIPNGSEKYFTVCHEIRMESGNEYTLYPATLHWFQAGDEGAVVSEFSTTSTDELDVLSDPRIVRKTRIV